MLWGHRGAVAMAQGQSLPFHHRTLNPFWITQHTHWPMEQPVSPNPEDSMSSSGPCWHAEEHIQNLTQTHTQINTYIHIYINFFIYFTSWAQFPFPPLLFLLPCLPCLRFVPSIHSSCFFPERARLPMGENKACHFKLR